MTKPYGYLTSALEVGVCVLCAVAPTRLPRRLRWVCFFLGFINELPFLAVYWIVLPTVLVAVQGDVATPVGWLALVLNLAALVGVGVLLARAARTGAAVRRAMGERAGSATQTVRLPVLPMLLWPFVRRRAGVRRIAGIRYGEARLQKLDVYLKRRSAVTGRPVFVHVHGGGFVSGHKNQESLPLIYHLARRGWLCISTNYRLGPAASRADQVADLRRMLDWVHAHAASHGGDPTRIVLAGGSAGAHLAALTAFTSDDPTIRGVVMLYAYFGELIDAPTRPGLPPFLVLHGTHDPLIPVQDARRFVAHLRALAPVAYAELPGAGHTFDIFHSPRSRAVVRAVEEFALAALSVSTA